MKILEWPAKELETVAQEVDTFDKELRETVKKMHATMDASGGIGLAANQVGILKRVIVMYIPYSSYEEENEIKREFWHDKRMTFVNPKIIEHSSLKESFREGCLSFPGIYDYVPRFSQIKVEAFDENGIKHQYDATGLFACCLQHKIDHIDGIVFFKRMSRLKAKMIKSKVAKRIHSSS